MKKKLPDKAINALASIFQDTLEPQLSIVLALSLFLGCSLVGSLTPFVARFWARASGRRSFGCSSDFCKRNIIIIFISMCVISTDLSNRQSDKSTSNNRWSKRKQIIKNKKKNKHLHIQLTNLISREKRARKTYYFQQTVGSLTKFNPRLIINFIYQLPPPLHPFN